MQAPLFLALSALTLALLLTPAFRNLSRKLGWFDLPDHARKLHPRPIPRIGGIPIVLAYTGAFALLLLPLPGRDLIAARGLPLAWNLIPAALVVFATGLADDLAGLQPWHKFAGQFAAAGLACWAGIRIDSIGPHPLPLWLAIPVTLLWLAACSNAFNLIDGIDGLAAGIGLLAATGTLIAALLTGHTGLVLATAPLAGALLGFLLFNFSPASVFPGDSGSLTIGFLLGCFAVIWSHKAATFFGMTAPLMVLSIPLADTTLAIGRRLLRRQPVFRGDRAHIHHKLLDRGLAPRRVALLLYGISGLAAAFSIVQSVAEKEIAAALLVLFCAAAWLAVQHLGYAEFGIAGRLMLPSTFFRMLHSELRLRALADELARANGAEECWDAIRAASRDFGFARLVMRMDGGIREEWLHETASPSNCWMLRVPLSHTDYVNIGHEFESRVEPMVLARFAGVLRAALERPEVAQAVSPASRRVRVASLAGLMLFCVIAAHAATPIGRVSSGEPFRLRGALVPVAGIPSWPLVAGDDIATDAAAAVLVFLDGTRVTLAPKSNVKLEAGEAATKIRLLEGSMQYRLGKTPAVEIYHRDARQRGTSGTIGRQPAPTGSGRIRTEALPPLSRSR